MLPVTVSAEYQLPGHTEYVAAMAAHAILFWSQVWSLKCSCSS